MEFIAGLLVGSWVTVFVILLSMGSCQTDADYENEGEDNVQEGI